MFEKLAKRLSNFFNPPTPVVGSVWRFYQEVGNPFETRRFVVVTAVANGFVQYKFQTNGLVDFSMSCRDFHSMYKEIHSDAS